MGEPPFEHYAGGVPKVRDEGGMDDRCTYVFDVDEWSTRVGIEDIDLPVDDVWHCPYAADEGADRCIFHRPPEIKDATAARDAFINTIRAADESGAEVYGAAFGELDLSYLTFRTVRRAPLNFTAIRVNGTLDLSHAQLEHPTVFSDGRFDTVDLSNARVSDTLRIERAEIGELVADQAEFADQVVFDYSEFTDNVSATNATFDGNIRFEQVEFGAEASFRYSRFNGRLSFEEAEVRGQLVLDGAELTRATSLRRGSYRSDIRFRDVTLGGRLAINEASIQGGIDAQRATINSPVTAPDSMFEGPLDFREVDVRAAVDLSGSTFGGPVTFSRAEFDALLDVRGALFDGPVHMNNVSASSPVNFDSSAFAAPASFEYADISERLGLEDVSLSSSGSLSFAGARINDIDVRLRDIETPTVVDCDGASLKGGRLQVDDAPVVFDLRNGMVGNIAVRRIDNREQGLLDALYFNNTNFENFPFSEYTAELERGNYIIDQVDDRVDGFEPPQPVTRVDTYLSARKGADEIDASRAVSKFYVREMRFRRASNIQRVKDATLPLNRRFRAIKAYISNGLLDIFAMYGEGPSRVLSTSFVTVLLFTGIYATLDVATTFGEGVSRYFLFSLQAFIALLVGAPNSPTLGLAFLVIVEAFLGAFYIALFIYTFTRPLDRAT